MPAGFHLPSDVSDFGKGHTLDLAYIMEERRHELAYLHREQQAARAAAAAGPSQLGIQPITPPGELPPQRSVTSHVTRGAVSRHGPCCSLQCVQHPPGILLGRPLTSRRQVLLAVSA